MILTYISSQVAAVSWLPPNVIHQNGVITQYQHILTNTDTSVVVDTAAGTSGYGHTWNHLIYNTNYSIAISAATSQGDGQAAIVSFTTSQIELKQCPICDIVLNGDCIVYVTTAMNWDNAEVNCIQLGGHLTSIHSSAENTALSHLRTNVEDVWIGYNDRTTEGTFVWSDMSTVD